MLLLSERSRGRVTVGSNRLQKRELRTRCGPCDLVTLTSALVLPSLIEHVSLCSCLLWLWARGFTSTRLVVRRIGKDQPSGCQKSPSQDPRPAGAAAAV